MTPLFQSIEADNFEEFKKIVNETPSVLNELDDDGWSILTLATHYEMPEYVEFLLDKMSPEQIQSQQPQSPLLTALDNGSRIAEILIEHPHIPVDIKFKAGNNLISEVIYRQQEYLVPKILGRGVSPFEENNQGLSAMGLIIEKGHENLFNLLRDNPELSSYYKEDWIKRSIKYNQPNIFSQLLSYTSLSADELFNLSVDFQRVQIAQRVLDTGDLIPGEKQITSMIDIMCQVYDNPLDNEAAVELADFLFAIKVPFSKFVNEQGQSAWMLSIENDNEHIFERLVQSNEAVNTEDDEKHTPLFYAIEKRNADFVKKLLKKRANPNHVDKHNETPLFKAVRQGNHEIVQALLSYPMNVNVVNDNQETALTVAIYLRKMNIITDLIWAGGEITAYPAKFIEQHDIFHINTEGIYEKLTSFVDEEHVDNFIALSKLGFNLNQINEDGDTFLLHFIRNGFLANFKALLRCSFNPDQIDSEGNSALMLAMRKNSDDYAIGMLWKFNNMDLSIKNQKGEDIYDIAYEMKRHKRMDYLVKSDPDISSHHASQALMVYAQTGIIEEDIYNRLKEKVQKIDKLVDPEENNLLMLSILGNQKENFKLLIQDESLNFNLAHKNSRNQNIVDLISALPEEDSQYYSQYVASYMKKPKKGP